MNLSQRFNNLEARYLESGNIYDDNFNLILQIKEKKYYSVICREQNKPVDETWSCGDSLGESLFACLEKNHVIGSRWRRVEWIIVKLMLGLVDNLSHGKMAFECLNKYVPELSEYDIFENFSDFKEISRFSKNPETICVIYQDETMEYSCVRYFWIGNKMEFSSDLNSFKQGEMLNWVIEQMKDYVPCSMPPIKFEISSSSFKGL